MIMFSKKAIAPGLRKGGAPAAFYWLITFFQLATLGNGLPDECSGMQKESTEPRSERLAWDMLIAFAGMDAKGEAADPRSADPARTVHGRPRPAPAW